MNGGNVIKGINTWAIPVLRYSAAFLNWTKAELQEMDQRTRKLLPLTVDSTLEVMSTGYIYPGEKVEEDS